jgi:translation initiation factor eIF-2B subunit epsilon
MGIVRSDPFILINGNITSNMNLKIAIDFHKERRKVDNDAVMTSVFKKVKNNTIAGIRPLLDDLVVALDKETRQIIYYDGSYKKKAANIPLEIMKSHSDLIFYSDIYDANIDICSPELILQFADNFDYQVIIEVSLISCYFILTFLNDYLAYKERLYAE